MLAYTEAQILTMVDNAITAHKTTPIVYYPYVSGALDIYKQRANTFGTGVTVIGRAILNPTEEVISIIGNDERYDIAFLFSKLEMDRKFPSAADGEWLDTSGEISWWNRRYKIEKVHPSGQVGVYFSLVIVLATTIQGSRD
jgi:hypothetical protein